MDLIARSEQVEEDRLVHPFLARFEMIAVYHRFSAVVHWDVVPGTPAGQDVQDTVKQPARITPGSADVRFVGGRGISGQLSPISCHRIP